MNGHATAMGSTQVPWREYRSRLYRFVRSRVRDDHAAEDIVHDVFVKALAKRDTLRDQDAMLPWLFQIAMNAIRDNGRRQRPDRVTDNEELFDDVAAEPTPQDMQDLASCLMAMIEHLDEPYRSAVKRSEIDGVQMRIIAEELGISLSGVKSRVQRGRAKLRDLMTSCCQLEVDEHGAPTMPEDHVCTTPSCTCCTPQNA